MRYNEIHNRYKLAFVNEAINLFASAREQLSLNEEIDANYALQTLSKMEKIAGYLVKSQLKNAGDIDRFDQFIVLVKGEVPNLTQAFNRMKLDTENMTTLNQRHQVFTR
jgi:hypothetical protein